MTRLSAIAAVAIAASVASHAPPARGAPQVTAVAKKHKKKVDKHKAKNGKPRVTAVARKKPPPPPPPLEGTSYDYAYDGKADGHPERRWLGRVFVHNKAAAHAGEALPVLVFLHGLNAEKIKFRWMGGGAEGDVRRIVAELIEENQIPPILVAAPSSIDPATMTNAGSAWPGFDLDRFLDRTIERLDGTAVVDRGRVIVAGHSGGGCNIHGGLATAMKAQATPVLAGMSIDTCMLFDLAKALGQAPRTAHVVVSWQSISWPEREFKGFSTVFKREVEKAPPAPGVLRELDYEQPRVAGPHDAMVGITLRKYLPRILGPGTPDPADPPAPGAAADAGAPDGG